MADPAVKEPGIDTSPAKTPTVDDAAMKSFLEKRGISDIGKLDEILDGYKGDLTKLKSDNKNLSEAQKELERLKAEAEERRLAELSEVQRLKEESEAKDAERAKLQSQVEEMKKSLLKDRVLFEHSKEKSLLKTRMKLYDIAAKTGEWESKEELQELFKSVDEEFDAELKALNIVLPAPGDGKGGQSNPSDESKYDQSYIDKLFKKKK